MGSLSKMKWGCNKACAENKFTNQKVGYIHEINILANYHKAMDFFEKSVLKDRVKTVGFLLIANFLVGCDLNTVKPHNLLNLGQSKIVDLFSKMLNLGSVRLGSACQKVGCRAALLTTFLVRKGCMCTNIKVALLRQHTYLAPSWQIWHVAVLK